MIRKILFLIFFSLTSLQGNIKTKFGIPFLSILLLIFILLTCFESLYNLTIISEILFIVYSLVLSFDLRIDLMRIDFTSVFLRKIVFALNRRKINDIENEIKKIQKM